MNRKPCTPNFNTPPEKFSKEELNKIAAGTIAGNVRAEFADLNRDDISWESEALAKSHGIYLEFNRDKEAAGNKEWIFPLQTGDNHIRLLDLFLRVKVRLQVGDGLQSRKSYCIERCTGK